MHRIAPLLFFAAPLAASCGGVEDHDLWLDVDAASPCFDTTQRVRAVHLRLAEVKQSPLALVGLPAVNECLKLDAPATRDDVLGPFWRRGYLVHDPPPNKTLTVLLMVYTAPILTCPPPEQRLYAACLDSEAFIPSLAPSGRVKMRVRCGPSMFAGLCALLK